MRIYYSFARMYAQGKCLKEKTTFFPKTHLILQTLRDCTQKHWIIDIRPELSVVQNLYILWKILSLEEIHNLCYFKWFEAFIDSRVDKYWNPYLIHWISLVLSHSLEENIETLQQINYLIFRFTHNLLFAF